MRRIARWAPLAALIAWGGRELTHIHTHIIAPQTLALCAVPPLLYCLCRWCRRRRRRDEENE